MPIRTLIVENDEASSMMLEAHLEQYEFIQIIDSVPTIKEALDLTLMQVPDLVFLDIELNDGRAFDYLEQIPKYRNISPDIIFMTAWSDYAVDAYRYLPFAFLEKPFSKPLLHKAIQKYCEIQKSASNNNADAIRNWLETKEQLQADQRKKFTTKDGFTYVNMDDIMYLEAERNYTIVYYSPDETITLTSNLGKVEEQLIGYKFLRLKRSIIINTAYVFSFSRKKHECVLRKNDLTVSISIPKERIGEVTKYFEEN